LLLGLRGLANPPRGHCVGARLARLLEHRLLVRRIALHGLDQVGDQVVASLELHVDAAPRLVDPIAAADHAVADEDVDQPREDDQRDYDDDHDSHVCSCSAV